MSSPQRIIHLLMEPCAWPQASWQARPKGKHTELHYANERKPTNALREKTFVPGNKFSKMHSSLD